MKKEREKRTLKNTIEKATNIGKAVASMYGPKRLPKDKEYDKVMVVPSNSQKISKDGTYIATGIGIPDDAKDVVIGYIVKNTEEKEEEQKKEPDKSKSKLRLLPIIIILPVFIGLGSCKAQTIEYVEQATPIEYVIYDTENPTIPSTGLNAQRIQESSNANAKNGQSPFYGDYYNCEDGYRNEQIAAKDYEYYEELKSDMQEKAKKLSENPSALNEMIDDAKKMQGIYDEKSELIDSSLEGFKEATDAFPDSNTEMEKGAAEFIAKEFYKEKDKADLNSQQLEELKDLSQQTGENVNIDSVDVDEIDGKITIKGESIRQIAETRTVTGLEAVKIKIQNFFKSLKQDKTNEQQNNQNTEER